MAPVPDRSHRHRVTRWRPESPGLRSPTVSSARAPVIGDSPQICTKMAGARLPADLMSHRGSSKLTWPEPEAAGRYPEIFLIRASHP